MRQSDDHGGHRVRRLLYFVGGMVALVVGGQIALRSEPGLWSTVLVFIFVILGLTFAAPDKAKELLKTITPLLTLLRNGKQSSHRDELRSNKRDELP